MKRDNTIRAALFGLCLVLAYSTLTTGCAKSAGKVTPSVPTTPEAKVLLITDTIGATLLTATSELVPLCAAQKIDAVTCTTLKRELLAINAANDKVIAEAGLNPATEPWTVAKGKIANIVATGVITLTVSDQTLQSTLTDLKNQLLQILGVQ